MLLQALLVQLEGVIAELAAGAGPSGVTRPGAFIFEILGRIGVSDSTWGAMQELVESCIEVLVDQATSQGRK